ncbi:MAG: amino acid adenylation domain-containing protein [Candidatus Omnitrophica bacterium]|nr:amino acid adenylation domain-containing protein [Candidatus Omnitrophota bacterium]MCB9721405.1 amino acid adenylation domain-containing protein [Candidatus Omnitrophota bacterium]
MDGPRHSECLHELIDSVAAIELDAIAIEFNNETVTYKELNSKAGRLAKYLHSLGAGPDVLVGVCVERSIDLIVTLLAVLKSGAAYVPLDPHYPADRIQTILSDASASVYITQSTLSCPQLPPECVTVLIDNDEIFSDVEYACPHVRPYHLAYVIYTSGSTGKPKGVQIEHRSVVNFLRSMQDEPGLSADDIVLAATTISFDISVLEIFLPLITGARIHLVDRATAADGQRLISHIDRVSLMQATPATWRLLLAAGWSGKADLRALCGGEAMPVDLACQLNTRCRTVWNMYGPTETTVWSSRYRVPGNPLEISRTVPIGTPIANTTLYVLDEAGGEVPAGETGELFIGGEGLARGYVNRPELTAEKFVENDHGRLYRTGDLVRFGEDGLLEYLGRTDHQVKVRGFRIELGEIEAVLMNHKAVQSAAVTVRETPDGDKSLTAYVVCPADISPAALRTHLGAHVPEYMIPNNFVFLTALPLTPNGKVDRRALPDPDGARPDLTTPYRAPESDLERRLSDIWAAVLGISTVGMDDNFFELGGHSLQATVILARIKETSQGVISYQEFFNAPTVARQAALLASAEKDRPAARPALVKRGGDGRMKLSYAQQRLWYLDQFEGGTTSYNMIEALRFQGPLDAGRLARAFSEIIRRHAILRTNYSQENGVPYQTVRPDATFTVQQKDLSDLPEARRREELTTLARQEARHHFDLQHDLLLRVWLVQMTEDEHVMLINCDHIVADEWSLDILHRELSQAYAGKEQDASVSWDPLPVQYADYAAWEREYLTDTVVDEKLTYWRQQLKDVPAVLELPVDFETCEGPRTRGGHIHFSLPEDISRRLQSFSARHEVTLFMTLFTAWATLISRFSGRDDVVIATTMANRELPEVARMIGFFVNVLPLRLRLSGDPRLTEVLARVKQIATEAFADQDLPLDLLIEKLHLWRGDMDHLPLSQVAFNFFGSAAEPFGLAGLQAEPLALDIQMSTTDLAMLVREQKGGLGIEIQYCAGLFKPETIEKLAGRFRDVINAMLSVEDATVTDICVTAGIDDPGHAVDQGDDYFHRYLDRTNLTGNQLLVWLGQKLDPADPIYNSVITYTLKEPIDPDLFQQAFQRVVDCRDSLRTSIVDEGGIPRQVVRDRLPCTVIREDFTRHSDPPEAARVWIERNSRTAYPLNGCLFTCALIKLGEEHYIWYMGQHHIITDGWSQSLIYHDLSRFYREAAGDVPHTDGTRVAFSNFVRKERELRQSARYAKARAYWENELARDPEPLRFYGQRPQKESTLVRRLSLNLGSELTATVIAAARAASPGSKSLEAAKFNVFLTLYALFVAHVSGQREFRIGIPLHNRRAPEFKGVTGLLMQVVPVTIRIDDGDSLQTLLHRIGRTVLKAMQHGQYVMRNPDHKPLYDVVLNYHMWKGPNFHRRPVGVEWVHPGHAQESLSLQVHDFEQEMEGKTGDLHIDLDFHADVFSPEMQHIALQQFVHLIKLYTQDTARPLSGISLLTDDDRTMLLGGVNATERDRPECCLHNLIEEQARRRPQAVAVEEGTLQLTYAQLDRQANRLAHLLQSRGAGPERPVGILVERGTQMIVALLAILKAGSCYVPLDPKSPPERLKGIVDEAFTQQGEEPLILTQQSLAELLPAGEGIILLDKDVNEWIDLPQDAPAHNAGPHNLAYIIYTSGSTGTPKGVMIAHRAIVNYTLHSVRQYRMTPADKVLQFSSITFDAAGEEIYPVLSAGGTLVLRDEETIRTPAAFIAKCNQHQVTLLSMPTTYFHQLTAAAGPEGPRFGAHLRMVLFGGERVFPQEIRRWQAVYPKSPQLVNTYGPTEATVVATTYFLPPAGESPDGDREIPIGQPVDNTQVYVLNADRQPVGVGIPGELCIGGAGLARGYLERPQLTDERFIPNPLRPHTDEKVYRTGDLVRLLPDGNLEFVGRVDDQVKVRGYRIELGEVESVMKDHPAVADCAVLALAGEGTDRKLAAYFTVQHLSDKGVEDPRAFLKERLPEYMIPAQFYRLETFPVTSQGKIDRRALPDIAADAVGPAKAYTAPANAEEETLARIWEEILGIERVGRNDDFFELGGHSLLATQIISRIQQFFQIELSLRTLFNEPTVRGLAEAIKSEKQKVPAGPAIARISREKHRVQLTEQGDLAEVKS